MNQHNEMEEQLPSPSVNNIAGDSMLCLKSKDKKYECSICNRFLSTKWNLKEHMGIHTGENLHTCEYCGKSFVRKRDLKSHLLIHTGIKSYICKFCESSFARKNQLKTHLMSNDNCSSVECEICKLSFAKKCGLKLHMKNHVGEKSHICETCGISFARKSRLERHILIHNRSSSLMKENSDKKLIKCEECEKIFRRRDNLKRHVIIHSRPQFPCNECKKSFSSEEKLNHHLKIHQDMTYVCEQCNKKFKQKSSLKHHLRIQHIKASIVPVNREIPLPDVQIKRLKHQKSALNVFKTLTFYPEKDEERDLDVFLENVRAELQYNLQSEMREKKNIKWHMVCKIEFKRQAGDEDIETVASYFRSNGNVEFSEDTIPNDIYKGFVKIKQSLEEFNNNDSNWLLRKIHWIELKIVKLAR